MPIPQATAGSATQEIAGKARRKAGTGSEHDSFTGLLEALAATSVGQGPLAPLGRPAGNRNIHGARAAEVETASPSPGVAPPKAPDSPITTVQSGPRTVEAGRAVAASAKSPSLATSPKAAALKSSLTGNATRMEGVTSAEPKVVTDQPQPSAPPASPAKPAPGEAGPAAQAQATSTAMRVAVTAPATGPTVLKPAKPGVAAGGDATVGHGAHGPWGTGQPPGIAAATSVPTQHPGLPQAAPGPASIAIPPSALQAMAAHAPPPEIPSTLPAQARAAIGNQVASAVSGQIRTEAAGARTTLQLRVFPESLGEVVVRLTTSGGSLTVHLSGSSAALGQMLHASRSEIAASLQSAGAANVSIEFGLFGGGARHHGGHPQPEAPNPIFVNPGWQASSVHPEQASESRGGRHRLDLLA